ncbi:PspC domain-containing protein [Kitasatospora sp. NPDC057015]|uniref:PspC domain-containing protein n=1 Tax=Kitasatospora sp. NPDC057015 TaxID=3346001 RepID=UPI003634B552
MTDDHTPGAGPISPPDSERPPLTRSEHHRVVAGVCGGLGRHLDIDPVVFRVVIAVLCLSGGLGLFLYGLAWLVVPIEAAEGREGRTELQRVLTGRVDGQSIGAVLLTVIGTGVFFSSMGDGDQLFPLLLLGGLIFLAVRRRDPEHRGGRQRRRHRGRRHGGPYDRLYPQAPEQPADAVGGGEEWRAAAEARARHAREREAGTVPQDTPHAGPTGYLWDPRHPERNPYAERGPYPGPTAPPGAPAQAWWQRTDLPEGDPLRKGPAPAGRPATPVRRRERSFLGPLGLLVTAGVCTLLWGLPGGRGAGVLITTAMAALLLGIGLTLLVGAKFGRARALVVPAVLLTLVLASGNNSGATVGDAFGDRVWAPTSAGELHREYRLGAGSGTLDLRGLDPAGGTLSTTARVGAGDLTVLVPPDVVVSVRARHILGNVQITGFDDTGDSNDRTYELQPRSGQASKGTLDLTLTVGLGDIKVVQA